MTTQREAGIPAEGVRDHLANALQAVQTALDMGSTLDAAGLESVASRLWTALRRLDEREPASLVAGAGVGAGMVPPPDIAWTELDIHGAPADTFPAGAQVFQGLVTDGFLMAVTFGEGMGPRGRPSIAMTISHVQSELFRVPGRAVRLEELIAAVRQLWPAGTFAGLVLAGGKNPEAIAPALYVSEVYPSQIAGPESAGPRIWTPEV